MLAEIESGWIVCLVSFLTVAIAGDAIMFVCAYHLHLKKLKRDQWAKELLTKNLSFHGKNDVSMGSMPSWLYERRPSLPRQLKNYYKFRPTQQLTIRPRFPTYGKKKTVMTKL